MSRIMFRFWLDDTKQDENELIGQVSDLKQTRSFSSTIRDGIKLITSLRDGSLDVLFQLFPFVKAEFLEYMRELKSDSDDSGNSDKERIIELERENAQLKERVTGLQALVEENEDYITEIEAELDKRENAQNKPIQAQLDRLEQLLMQQGSMPIDSVMNDTQAPVMKPVGLKGFQGQHNTATAPAPIFDDDSDDENLLEVTKADSSNSNANANFLKSMLALQQQPQH